MLRSALQQTTRLRRSVANPMRTACRRELSRHATSRFSRSHAPGHTTHARNEARSWSGVFPAADRSSPIPSVGRQRGRRRRGNRRCFCRRHRQWTLVSAALSAIRLHRTQLRNGFVLTTEKANQANSIYGETVNNEHATSDQLVARCTLSYTFVERESPVKS